MKSRIPGLLAAGLLATSASQAQTTETPQPAAAPAVVAPAEQAPAATPVQGAEPQSAAKRPKAPPGYTLGKRWEDGTYLFCREFSRVGTRFKEKICLTQEEYDEVERRSQLMRESMQKPRSCIGTLCRYD